MVICRYFLQGTCKFGNNCRYEHSYREYDNEGSPSNSHRRSYSGLYQESANRYSQVHQNPVPTNVRELIQVVINELNQSERGGQWPLSCFAPFKERPCYPGLDDYSPEEIRWQMYEAVQSGAIEECKRRIQQLEESYKMRKNSILHPTPETYATIEKLFRGEIPTTNSQLSSVAPAQFSFNVSHNRNDQIITANLFGATPALANTHVTPNLFGGSTDLQQRNLFSTTAQTISTTNVFGKNQISGGPHLFGDHNTVSKNAFVGGSEAINNSTFLMKPQQTSFSNTLVQPSSGRTQEAALPIGISNDQCDYLYTSLNELTESENNSFSSQTFTVGHIPTRPPPKEFCM